jgi:hypothetical protein
VTDQSKPTLSDLIRNVATKDRLRVTAGATTSDLNDALHQVYNDRNRDDQPGRQRLVRNSTQNVSDLLQKLRDMPDDEDGN